MDKIAILDFGSQFTHLLANRVRRLGVYSEILDSDTPASELKHYKGLLISGGPASVNAPGAPTVDPAIFDLGIPILGVCYGHQLIMKMLGGRVEKGEVGEYGLTEFAVLQSKGHLAKLDTRTYQVYASHFDTVAELPQGFEPLGSTPEDAYSATWNPSRHIYTLQFHPEVTHSEGGMDMLDAFLDITGASRDWNMDAFIEAEIASIHQKVGERKVFMLVSGGVDSTVAYALLTRALGPDRVYALFVNTGFMRLNEAETMQEFMKQAGIPALHVEDASEEFFTALSGSVDPEQKRKIIGDTFLQVQRRVVQELNMDPKEWLLGQGTIYPDTIESGGTKNADKIKTHHNRVPEIEAMIEQGLVIEPIKELYKDEVRALGRKLGLSAALVDRHPFPGPGLAVRCLCAEGPVGEILPVMNFSVGGDYPIEAKGHILPLRSVGVQGDERTYRQPMLLDLAGHSPKWDALSILSNIITNKDKRVNRVLATIALKSGKPVESVAILPTTLTPQRIHTLQQADHLVNQKMQELDPQGLVWQFPVVLIPVDFNQSGEEAIVLRPISSENGMTANFTELNQEKLQELAQDILQIEGISSVLFDLTNKPPATIEWE
jgi:GMP synthase (glutamine-hydrolysing)